MRARASDSGRSSSSNSAPKCSGRETGRIHVDFMPDNLSWRDDGKLLATGVTEIGELPDCPLVDGDCAHGFGVAAIDLKSFTATPVILTPFWNPWAYHY